MCVFICTYSLLLQLNDEASSIIFSGGNMTFEGNNLSLVCYHGINLRSKSWVVFIMQEPGVSFSTEAQQVISEGMYLYVLCYA